MAPMVPAVELVCPEHMLPLRPDRAETGFLCAAGCRFPRKDGIPRFVPTDNYAAGFGLQWNAFRRTQLDSFTRTTLSRDRLRRIAGGDLEIFRGRSVLEAGCGAGRFTEIMLDRGARVFSTDLSLAVEANYMNCGHWAGYFVCQADIARIPARDDSFDVVVCVGVVQHTPDPEATMRALCRYLRPGGLLLIDHYTPGYPATPTRRVLRALLLKCPVSFSMRFCRAVVAVLWPLHKLSFRLARTRIVWRLRQWVLKWSPVVDYQDPYPQLGAEGLYQWAILDTHDTLTDRYKHLRTPEQIRATLEQCGMVSIKTENAGNGVEVRAIKQLIGAGER